MACRRMVKARPLAFLAWLIPAFSETACQTGWVDTRRISFPGRPDQTGDLVFELKLLALAQELWALALEFQFAPDSEMFGRLLIYLGTIWLEQRPATLRGSRYQLGACVVNLTGTSKSTPATQRFVCPGPDHTECVLVVRERYLAEESAEDLLDAIGVGRYDRALLPWIPLHRGSSSETVIGQCVELANAETDEARRANFAEKSENPSAWRKALEGWNMIRSETMEKTRREGRQDAILRILTSQTRSEIPEDLRDKVRTCFDLVQLDRWLVIAASSATIDQFRERTQQEIIPGR